MPTFPMLLPPIFAATLAGCAQLGDTKASEGAAVYRLKSPQCEVEIVSARGFASGQLQVGDTCTIDARVDAVDGLEALDLARRILGGAP